MSEIVVEIPKTAGSKGSGLNEFSKSDYQTLQSAFPASGIHTEAITNDGQRKKFFDELKSLSTDATGNRIDTFSQAPDLSSVSYTSAGDPASPFLPNPTSSPSGDPADQPAPPADYGKGAPKSSGYGDGATANAADRNPAVRSKKIAATIGETLTMGKSHA